MDKKEKGNYEKWSRSEKDELLRLLVESANNGCRGADGSFSKQLLASKVLPALNAKFKGKKTVDHVRNKLRVWRRQYQPVADLMASNSGFGWDPLTQKITAPDEMWEEYLKHHPNALKYQTERIDDFDELKIVVGNSCVSGRTSYGMEVAVVSPAGEEKELEDDPLPEGLDVSNNSEGLKGNGPSSLPTPRPPVSTGVGSSDTRNRSPSGSITSHRKRKVGQVASSSRKFKLGESIADRLLSSVEAIVENMKAIREIFERPPSSVDLWKALEETPDLDRTLRFRAADLFVSPVLLDMFVRMDPATRKEWILFKLHD